MEMIHGPSLETRTRRATPGIRTTTPIRAMVAARDRLGAEMFDRLRRLGTPDAGPAFLRLHVVDMQGDMDIDVSVVGPDASPGDDRLRPGDLPAGHDATLTCRDHALQANRMLLDWVAANGITLARQAVPQGQSLHLSLRNPGDRPPPRTPQEEAHRAVRLSC
jgi:hypothetical protein